MKKAAYLLIFLLPAHLSQGQNFMNKMKNKIANAVEKPVANTASSTAPGVSSGSKKYTNPSGYGVVVMKFTTKEVDQHMMGGGFDFCFRSVKVSGGNIQFEVSESDKLYSYSGSGQLQNTGRKPSPPDWITIYKGSELNAMCKEFSTLDYQNAFLKSGPHIQGIMVPGKPERPFIFNGKTIGSYVTGFLAHNVDSTVIGVVGQSYGGGKVSYILASSSGQKCTLPWPVMEPPLISPDGKKMAALHPGSSGFDVYSLDGKQSAAGNASYDKMWIRNSGSVFNIDISNAKTLMKDGTPYHTLDVPVDLSSLFISADDKRICWQGDHGLFFSDGTIFENGETPYRTIINNKEVIIFMDIDIESGTVYLCQHDL